VRRREQGQKGKWGKGDLSVFLSSNATCLWWITCERNVQVVIASEAKQSLYVSSDAADEIASVVRVWALRSLAMTRRLLFLRRPELFMWSCRGGANFALDRGEFRCYAD